MERDADLLAALRRGDRHAVLEGLMDRYRQKVMHLAVSIVHNPALAEDLSQTTFVKVWQALPKFDGRAALSTWLYTIARNTCLTAIERERRVVALEDFAEAADDDGDPMLFGRERPAPKPPGRPRRNMTWRSCSSGCRNPTGGSWSFSIWKTEVVRKSANFCPCPRVQ